MAKQPPTKSGSSKIRFIMLDAEIPEGELGQIASAIQNALKPVTILQAKLPQQENLPAISQGDLSEKDEQPSYVDSDGEEDNEQPTRHNRPTRNRKVVAPKVVDVDLSSDVSLKDYVAEHDPKSVTEKYLLIAAYFKEHRNEDCVTADQVYTCFRHLGWPAGIADFSSTLRQLKKGQYMTTPARGQYSINHLGLERVRNIRSG